MAIFIFSVPHTISYIAGNSSQCLPYKNLQDLGPSFSNSIRFDRYIFSLIFLLSTASCTIRFSLANFSLKSLGTCVCNSHRNAGNTFFFLPSAVKPFFVVAHLPFAASSAEVSRIQATARQRGTCPPPMALNRARRFFFFIVRRGISGSLSNGCHCHVGRGATSDHPTGHPINHSTQSGFSPPSLRVGLTTPPSFRLRPYR